MEEDVKNVDASDVEQASVRRSGLLFAVLAIIILILMGWLRSGGLHNSRSSIDTIPSVNPLPDEIPNGRYTILGTGQPRGSVQLLVDDEVVATLPVSSAGQWIYSSDYAAGEYSIRAVALDEEGALGNSSEAALLRVFQTYAPPTLLLPGNDGDPADVTITGTGTPGSTVELFINGESIGTTTVDDDGNWSLATAVSGYGSQLRVLGYDPDGNEIGESDTIDWYWANAAAPLTFDVPSLGELSLSENGMPTGDLTLSGTGEPGSRVNIEIDGEPFRTASIGDDGFWSLTHRVELEPGDYEISGTMIAVDGTNLGSASADALSVPAVGSITLDEAAANDSGGLTLAGTASGGMDVNIWLNGEVVDTVAADEDGTWRWESDGVLDAGAYEVQAQLADLPDVVSETMDAMITPFVSLDDPDVALGDNGESGDVTLNGRALPNSRVEIFVDGQFVGETTADSNGEWTFELSLERGAYTITARGVGPDGSRRAETAVRAVVGESVGGLSLVYAGTRSDEGEVEESDGATAVSLESSPAVEIILDASWSMVQPIDGDTTRFAVAQEALIDVVSEVLPEGTPTALRIFGNVEGNLACRTDLMVPYGPLDREAFNEVVLSAAPQVDANTAIAASLLEVPNDLADADETERIIVLLTDGEETCGGDPAAAIQQLVDAGFNVQVNIVGLAIAEQTLKDEFARWAQIGGGAYYDVQNPGQLIDAMRTATGAAYTVRDAEGNVVANGRIGGPTIDLEPGTYSIEIRTDPATVIEDVTVEESEVVRIVLN